MGYSKNPAVLRQIEQRLRPLLKGGILSWPNEADPDNWAYKVRQGFHIARKNPKLFPELARIAGEYRIEVLDGVVRAVPKRDTAVEVAVPTVDLMDALKYSLAQRTQAQVIDAPASVEQVISFWISYQPSLDPMRITNCNFTNEEIEQLTRWASVMEPAWYVRHAQGTTEIVVSPHQG